MTAAPPFGVSPIHLPPSLALSVVIPCFRSGDWIDALAAQIVATLDARPDDAPGAGPFEVVLVHDASDVQTWEAISRAAAADPRVRGLDMAYNVGQFKATLCGFEHARGRLIVTMDDDFQHPIDALDSLLAPLFAGGEADQLDCVFADFHHHKQHSLVRNAGSGLANWLNAQLHGKPKDVRLSSYRAIRRATARAAVLHRTAFPILGPLLLRVSRRVTSVPIPHQERQHGTTTYTLRQLVRIVMDNVVLSTTWPLRWVAVLGLLSAAGSFVLGLSYLLRFFGDGIGVPGWTTQVLLTAFFGGVTLFTLGLLGEYLARIVDETARPPRYVLRDDTAALSLPPGVDPEAPEDRPEPS